MSAKFAMERVAAGNVMGVSVKGEERVAVQMRTSPPLRSADTRYSRKRLQETLASGEQSSIHSQTFARQLLAMRQASHSTCYDGMTVFHKTAT